MAKYGMAIDLQKCLGCGACALACKTENNTEFEQDGRKYNWADFLASTEGTFAAGDVKHTVRPVLCNHCTDAPCVRACPVSPKAMFKTEDGKLEALALNDTNNLEIRVFPNEDHRHAVVIARLDNLGKGASGAAVQSMNVHLGVDEALGLA